MNHVIQSCGDGLRHFILQNAKGGIFQRMLQIGHANPFGKRRIDFQRFTGNAGSFFGLWNVINRIHIMRAVGQLDQQHPNIFAHCQQ